MDRRIHIKSLPRGATAYTVFRDIGAQINRCQTEYETTSLPDGNPVRYWRIQRCPTSTSHSPSPPGRLSDLRRRLTGPPPSIPDPWITPFSPFPSLPFPPSPPLPPLLLPLPSPSLPPPPPPPLPSPLSPPPSPPPPPFSSPPPSPLPSPPNTPPPSCLRSPSAHSSPLPSSLPSLPPPPPPPPPCPLPFSSPPHPPPCPPPSPLPPSRLPILSLPDSLLLPSSSCPYLPSLPPPPPLLPSFCIPSLHYATSASPSALSPTTDPPHPPLRCPSDARSPAPHTCTRTPVPPTRPCSLPSLDDAAPLP